MCSYVQDKNHIEYNKSVGYYDTPTNRPPDQTTTNGEVLQQERLGQFETYSYITNIIYVRIV